MNFNVNLQSKPVSYQNQKYNKIKAKNKAFLINWYSKQELEKSPQTTLPTNHS